MQKKQFNITPTKIVQDIAPNKFPNDAAFSIRNMRVVTTGEGLTTMSLVTEKGNTLVDNIKINGTVLGVQEVDNNNVVLFICGITKEGQPKKDQIIMISKEQDSEEIYSKQLYQGVLNFDCHNPIESSKIINNTSSLIVWTDNLNPLRVLDINRNYTLQGDEFVDSSQLLFAPHIPDDIIEVKYINSNSQNLFHGGTLQYAITYSNQDLQESNIVYISDLLFPNDNGRALDPEGKQVGTGEIKISIKNLQMPFWDNINIYRIYRTVKDETPNIQRQQYKISTLLKSNTSYQFNLELQDIGRAWESVDFSILTSNVASSFKCATLETSSEIIFTGNIQYLFDDIIKEVQKNINKIATVDFYLKTINTEQEQSIYELNDSSKWWVLESSLTQEYKNTYYFRSEENYYFGIQMQDKSGRWSEVIYIGVKSHTYKPVRDYYNDKLLRIPQAICTLDFSNFTELLTKVQNNFINIRLVCHYPTDNDRCILGQGIITPTVFNALNRKNNLLYAQPSWVVRPFIATNEEVLPPKAASSNSFPALPISDIYYLKTNIQGTRYATYNQAPDTEGEYSGIGIVPPSIFPCVSIGGEIEGVYPQIEVDKGKDPFTDSQSNNPSDFIKMIDQEHTYFLDGRICTIHSPNFDYKFNKNLEACDIQNLKCKIVGYTSIKVTFSDLELKTENNSNFRDYQLTYDDYYARPPYLSTGSSSSFVGYFGESLVSLPLWADKYNPGDGGELSNSQKGTNFIYYPIYMWQKQGSLFGGSDSENHKNAGKSKLKEKILSYKRVCMPTVWLSECKEKDDVQDYIELPVDYSKLWFGGKDATKTDIIKLFPKSWNQDITYKGVIEQSIEYHGGAKCWSAWGSQGKEGGNGYNQALWNTDYSPPFGQFRYFYQSGDHQPVPIEYKSDSHYVIALKYNTLGSSSQHFYHLLPSYSDIESNNIPYIGEQKWRGEGLSEQYNFKKYTQDYLWRDFRDVYNLTNPSYTNYTKNIESPGPQVLFIVELYRNKQDLTIGKDIVFNVCSSSYNINKIQGTSINISETFGDTMYSRYDCLRTTPYSEASINKLIEVVSFMCETTINIDGRYDRNRQQKSNLNISESNFNLVNEAYDQLNNIEKAYYLPELTNANILKNSILYSYPMNAGAFNILNNLKIASTNIIDISNTDSGLTKLISLKNNFYCIGQNGIYQLLYNNSGQVQVDNSPNIYMQYNKNIQGVVSIYNNVGSTNIFSIAYCNDSIVFIDSNNRNIYIYDGQNLQSILYNNISYFNKYFTCKIWNIFKEDSMKILYNKYLQEIYFITNKETFTYSIPLQGFISFYDYGKAYYMFTLDTDIYQIKDNQIWKMHSNDKYCNFFGEQYSYNLSIIANPEFQIDKVFDTLEFRTDGTEEFINNKSNEYPFNKLTTTNEYQTAISDTSKLKKKFRTWRWQIGRDQANNRDRIRNNWAKITLEGNSTDRVQLYDLTVDYYV